MIYGYIRVSTDKQTVENQRFEINRFIKKNGLKVDAWIEETISGTVAPNKRNLGKLISKTKKGDIIICSELSRLGRSMFMIMSILNILMENGLIVYTVKERYKLGEDLTRRKSRICMLETTGYSIWRTVTQTVKGEEYGKINKGSYDR